MVQNWRLGDFDDTAPFMPERTSEESPKPRKEVHRLMIEAARRSVGLKVDAEAKPGVSRVEVAMQRNAPDLAGASDAELAVLRAEQDALESRKWPRPRLLSLIMVATLALVMPSATVRILIWSQIMLLVAAVAVGPERVRDGARNFGLWCAGYWQHELRLAQRLISGGN